MTDKEKFYIIADRIKEKSKEFGLNEKNEWTIYYKDRWLTYFHSPYDTYIFFLIETAVLEDGDIIDAVTEFFYPENFNFDEFKDICEYGFKYLLEGIE